MAERAFSSSACSPALAILIGGRTYAEKNYRWLTPWRVGLLEARLSA